MNPQEFDKYEAFKKVRATAPFYRKLIFSSDSTQAPYSSENLASVEVRDANLDPNLAHHPNFRLGLGLQRHAAEALADRIQKLPGYADFKYSLVLKLLESRGNILGLGKFSCLSPGQSTPPYPARYGLWSHEVSEPVLRRARAWRVGFVQGRSAGSFGNENGLYSGSDQMLLSLFGNDPEFKQFAKSGVILEEKEVYGTLNFLSKTDPNLVPSTRYLKLTEKESKDLCQLLIKTAKSKAAPGSSTNSSCATCGPDPRSGPGVPPPIVLEVAIQAKKDLADRFKGSFVQHCARCHDRSGSPLGPAPKDMNLAPYIPVANLEAFQDVLKVDSTLEARIRAHVGEGSMPTDATLEGKTKTELGEVLKLLREHAGD